MKSFRSIMAILLSLALIYTPFLHAAQLSLPSGDLVAPEVSHEVITEDLQAGSSMQIKATVTDNVGVKSVTLFYRIKGEDDYNRVNMQQLDDSNVYATTLGQDDIVTPGIEYYIQAMDLAGNSLLHGYSFSPLAVNVVPDTDAATTESVADTSAPQKTEEKSSTMKWVWIGLGILAAGVAVAALSGGGGDDGGGSTGGQPSGSPSSDTSTVTITAPVPSGQ